MTQAYPLAWPEGVMNRAALVSIRPVHAQRIADGSKRWEFRAGREVSFKEGDRIFVYESSPTCSVVGCATVGDVLYAPLSELWRRTRNHSPGLDEEELYEHFGPRKLGSAIELRDYRGFKARPHLHELRASCEVHWSVPQQYTFFDKLPVPITDRLVGLWCGA